MKIIISIAQMSVAVSKPGANLRKAEALIAEAVKRRSDIVCFPEMWTTGFNWEYNERARHEHENAIRRVAEMAACYRVWINGSMPALAENGSLANASILFDPTGKKAGVYHKTHLYGLIHEDRHMEAGNSLCVIDAPWGLTGLSVCYDIRFPELFRTYAIKGVKIIFSPAAFPRSKVHHWKTLVRARAIENQMFMAAANQVGGEDLGPDGATTYAGASMIIDPWGEIIAEANETDETLITAAVDIGCVDEIRGKMNVLGDRRPELYELR